MDDKIIIYYAGNALLDEDAMPFRILPELERLLPQVEFRHHDPNENIMLGQGKLIIIDTVINTEQVIAISDPERLHTEAVYSPHDWDLALNLKLLIKLGQVKEFLIIGLPPAGDESQIAKDAAEIIKTMAI